MELRIVVVELGDGVYCPEAELVVRLPTVAPLLRKNLLNLHWNVVVVDVDHLLGSLDWYSQYDYGDASSYLNSH